MTLTNWVTYFLAEEGYNSRVIYLIFCSPLGWSGQGCHVKSIDNTQTECSCSHLTHFAVLMQFDSEFGPPISEVGPKV